MAEPKLVTLVDKNGQECNVSHPADITNLVYGQGYKVKGNKTPAEAAEFLAQQGVAAEQIAAQNQVVETKK